MTWHLGMLAAFDLETTGIDVENDRIVTACVALIDGSGQTPPNVRQWLADPGIDIPEGATAVHGITTAEARAKGAAPVKVVAEILTDLADALAAGIPIVGHNVSYDLTLLDREARRNSIQPLTDPAPVIDTMVLDKAVDKWRKGGRKLTDACTHYGCRIDGAHDASHDALAAARVAWKIAHKHPQIAQMTLAGLHEMQQVAKKAQDAGFADYLRRQNKPADGLTGHWPVIPVGGE
jgi:DNA polymerase-3 subunit epsilon